MAEWVAIGLSILGTVFAGGALRQRVLNNEHEITETKRELNKKLDILVGDVKEINKFLRDTAVDARLRGK